MKNPTQHRIYQFVKQFMATEGYTPSLSEIAKGIGARSKGTISRYLHAMEAEGWINLEKGHRQIRLIEKPLTSIPLLGTIAAGKPIEALADTVPLDLQELFQGRNRSNKPLFALRVKGDSMIEEGIFEDDIVVCKKSQTAQDGEIVVALVDNHEATLKRIHYLPYATLLIPANTMLSPMAYEPNRVQVQGIFVGLLRLPQQR
jgi:repressor LexA